MSRVKNPNTLEGVVHQGFHLLAAKHKIDVDKISEIIGDWTEWCERNLHKVASRKIKPKTEAYGKIIRILCPADFYWLPDGKLDGCSFDVSGCVVSRHQRKLLDDVLGAIGKAVESDKDDAAAEIPDIIKHAFGEG